jgi:hypothetical protein
VYSMTFSVQWQNGSNQIHDANIWLAKNGTAVPDTDSKWSVVEMHGGTPGHAIGTVNYVLKLNAGDYVELFWQTTSTDIILEYSPAVAPAPAIPSIILTAAQVMYTQAGATGSTGPSGAQGVSGIPGQSIIGATGASGIQGVSGVPGQSIVGATGASGIQGVSGVPGQSIVGATGASGVQGVSGIPGQSIVGATGATGPAAAGIGILTEFTGTGSATQFFPISGYLGDDAASYIVTIDAALQHPGTVDGGYSISSANGGTITFASAPASGALVAVRIVRGAVGATGPGGGPTGPQGATGPEFTTLTLSLYGAANTDTVATYSPSLTDNGKQIEIFNLSQTCTITLPSDASVGLPIGAQILFAQGGPGQLLFAAGSGAQIKSFGSAFKTVGQDIVVCAVKCAANTWRIVGDLTA